MSVPERVEARNVTISCSTCGTAEIADATLFSGAPTIVCRNCGETWPPTARSTAATELVLSPFGSPRRSELLEAQRRPLVTFSDGADRAWAARIAADVDPQTPRRPRLLQTAGLMAAALFLTAFFGGRDAAVMSLPDLAGLYAAIGLPVNLTGLAIEDLSAHRGGSSSTPTAASADRQRVTVRGTIRNATAQGHLALPLTVALTDASGQPILERAFNPPARTIEASGAQPFVLEFDDVPRQAARIVLRFREPTGAQIAAGEGPTARR